MEDYWGAKENGTEDVPAATDIDMIEWARNGFEGVNTCILSASVCYVDEYGCADYTKASHLPRHCTTERFMLTLVQP
jgi:hypothetical protein